MLKNIKFYAILFSDMTAFSNLYLGCADFAIASLKCLSDIIRLHINGNAEYRELKKRLWQAWYKLGSGLIKYETQPNVIPRRHLDHFFDYYFSEVKLKTERRTAVEKVVVLTLPEVGRRELLEFNDRQGEASYAALPDNSSDSHTHTDWDDY